MKGSIEFARRFAHLKCSILEVIAANRLALHERGADTATITNADAVALVAVCAMNVLVVFAWPGSRSAVPTLDTSL